MYLIIRENQKLSKLDDKQFAKKIYDKGFTRINSNIQRYGISEVLVFNNEHSEISRCFYLSGIDFDRSGRNRYHYKLEETKHDNPLRKLIGKKIQLKSCIPYQTKEINEDIS